MRAIALLVLACALLGVGGSASAADCAALTGRDRIAACVGDDFARADATLNELYKRLSARLDAGSRDLLRDAERAWIPFRDKHCAFVGSASEGGSIQAMVVGDCQTELTVDRAAQLAWQVNCDPTDAACAR